CSFALERFTWTDLAEGDGVQLVALEVPPDAAVDGLRIDFETPHRGLLLSGASVENAAGAPVWQLDLASTRLADYLASAAAQAGGCSGWPIATQDGILLAK